MSRKGPEPGIAEVAESAEQRIRVLQNRIAERESGGRKGDPAEDLERELQKYFSAAAAVDVDQIRRRVIDGVVEKLIRDWGGAAPLEDEIVNRLVERVLERFTSGSRNPGS